jgi:hypothetical protein
VLCILTAFFALDAFYVSVILFVLVPFFVLAIHFVVVTLLSLDLPLSLSNLRNSVRCRGNRNKRGQRPDIVYLSRSPYWLVAHNRREKARENLVKLHAPDYDIDGHMAEIHETLARVNQDNASQGSMRECFSKKNWRRTLVAISPFFIQNACGNSWVIGYMSCEYTRPH